MYKQNRMRFMLNCHTPYACKQTWLFLGYSAPRHRSYRWQVHSKLLYPSFKKCWHVSL